MWPNLHLAVTIHLSKQCLLDRRDASYVILMAFSCLQCSDNAQREVICTRERRNLSWTILCRWLLLLMHFHRTYINSIYLLSNCEIIDNEVKIVQPTLLQKSPWSTIISFLFSWLGGGWLLPNLLFRKLTYNFDGSGKRESITHVVNCMVYQLLLPIFTIKMWFKVQSSRSATRFVSGKLLTDKVTSV